MNKSAASILKLIISLGLGFLIIFLVANNFKKPLKVKLDKKQFGNESVWTLQQWNGEADYINVGDTLAVFVNEKEEPNYLVSIYEGTIVSKDVRTGATVVGGDVVSKVKVDIWKIIKEAFKKTNYWWIFLSIVIALTSHWSRAVRWQMLFEPLGYKPKIGNAFGAVLVMYMANLAFPRLGEVLRCSILARYEKIPIQKSLGTMITERAIDVICLLGVVGLCLILQRQIFIEFYNSFMPEGGNSKFIILGGLAVAGLIALLLYKTGKLPFAAQIGNLVKGLWSGIISIKDLKRPGVFIMHTAFIWVQYYLMIAVCLKALPETSSVTFLAGFPMLFFGGIAMVAVQGGLGLYPYFISKILVMYGVAETVGYAFGWVIWSGQTALVIVAGLIAYFLLIAFNKDKALPTTVE
ncbi:MAG: flippase-like domain-containing protein [Bacteroidetes bacterium]|nr:flippase-like domain-containing protein [Bacteroidota bacterium]